MSGAAFGSGLKFVSPCAYMTAVGILISSALSARFRLFKNIMADSPQAAQKLLVIYMRDSIALRFQPFKRMYENRSKIAQNSTCSKGVKKRSLP